MTRLLILLAGASGLGLFVSGLPPFRRDRLARRVEPYIGGLKGRPSALLSATRVRGRVAEYVGGRWGSHAAARRLTARLVAAGYERSAAEFRVEQLAWGLGALAGAWGLVGLAASAGAGVEPRALPGLGLIAFAIGFLGRDHLLARKVDARRARMQDQLPVALDLVTLSVMAGESVAAAFVRVGNVLGGGLGEEFAGVVADVRAGAPLVESLERFKNRVPDYAVVRFVDALCTGIERGAPLADVVRAQAGDAREARRRRILELGGKREVLMLVPVVFLIMPVVIVFALFPGLVSLDILVP